MYLLKIHEDLYQWNLCILGWNLRVRWKREKLHFEKTLYTIVLQLLLNMVFMVCITTWHVTPKIIHFHFPGKKSIKVKP